jgi:cysteine-rich repeat protein
MEHPLRWWLSAGAICALLSAPPVSAHDVRLPLAADEIRVLTGQGNAFSVQITEQDVLLNLFNLDPATQEAAILVFGTGAGGAGAGSTGLIELDPSLWVEVFDGPTVSEYRYDDPDGAAGGIKAVSLKKRELRIEGSGPNWPWAPDGAQDQLWFHFRLREGIEEEWVCAEFDEGTATLVQNQQDALWWTESASPGACPDPLCGNGVRELPEVCDDGNLVDDDGCSNDCSSTSCETPEFESTFEGIQSVIFDGYGCTNGLCHSPAVPPFYQPPQGGLDLTAGVSYSQLVGAPSTVPAFTDDGLVFYDRVEPGEPIASSLFERLSAKTNGTPSSLIPMPTNTLTLTRDHLEAVERWIRAGAPENASVTGTAGLLGTCLPPDDPLKIDPPPAPPAVGEGVQFWSTAWPLPNNSEDEICMATYYDLTQTDLVPEGVQIDCPGFGDANNPSGKCFYYNRRVLRQDAQSHHSIIQIYTGAAGVLDPGPPGNPDARFGPFAYRPNDRSDPRTGQPCDPTVVDPATGFHQDCSGQLVSGVACTGFGPPDSFQAPAFSGSQEPYVDNSFADGVYSVLPMSGVIIWNSHAFNLTEGDTTMAQYLDVEFAGPDPQELRWPAQGIFDTSKIFVQQVPPFESREYCRTFTLPEGARLFELGSHTHRWGSEFRIWEPPNEPCYPGDPGDFELPLTCEPDCQCASGDPDQLIYVSTDYTDPVQLEFDSPRLLSGSEADRTLLYCSVYDNGETPTSPPVKRQSTSPDSPPFDFGLPFPVALGGPCPDVDEPIIAPPLDSFLNITRHGVSCMDGPNQGVPCGNEDAASFCETAPGLGDGVCDACEVMGGFTTEDEMFILLGNYYLAPEPEPLALGLAALGGVSMLARRARRCRGRAD